MRRALILIFEGCLFFLFVPLAFAATRGDAHCDKKFNSKPYPVMPVAIREWSIFEATCQTEFGANSSTFDVATWYNQELARQGFCVNQVNIFPPEYESEENIYVFSVSKPGDFGFGLYISPNDLTDKELSGRTQIWISYSDEIPSQSTCYPNLAGKPFPNPEKNPPHDYGTPLPLDSTPVKYDNPWDQVWDGIGNTFWNSPIGQGIKWIWGLTK